MSSQFPKARGVRLVALLAVLAMFVAACGSDEPEASSDEADTGTEESTETVDEPDTEEEQAEVPEEEPETDELVALYNRASVCLHTSRLEGWGLVPMEAAACGCAVVATASRGVSEYLSDGRSMCLVDVGDAHGLAAHAARLLSRPDERIQIAVAGIEDVSRFSWAESTDRLESVLLQSA